MVQIAVIDVETTGKIPHRHNRIVEIAVVVIEPTGSISREFVTLINPERDIGPSHVHGLVSADILSAPRFHEILGGLFTALDGCGAVAGHNVRFDHSFLHLECERAGCKLPDIPRYCTMQLGGGGKLAAVCDSYGIHLDHAHSALHDARAAAALLVALLNDAPQLRSEVSGLRPTQWPSFPNANVPLVTREASRKARSQTPTYLQKLLAHLEPELPEDENESAATAYLELLDQVLEDRQINEKEGEALIDVAIQWGMAREQVLKVNLEYLNRLVAVALEDGIVTDAERRDLNLVANLLGISQKTLDNLLLNKSTRERIPSPHRETISLPSKNEDFRGKCVCFTGECLCRIDGQLISRETAQMLASRHGLMISESVTKKLDVLVVADPQSQSGKARKARDYGIRILHEPVFWRALGLKVE